MRSLTCLAAAAAIAATPLTAAFAQPGYYAPPPGPGYYWHADPCAYAQHRAATNGAITGGVLGAIAGSILGGRGGHGAGAFVGGATGAVIGSQVARSQVRCVAYPYGYRPHPHCHWVVEDGRGFEVCRAPDGYWRPWRPAW